MKAKGKAKAKARKAPTKDLTPKASDDVKGGRTASLNIEGSLLQAYSSIESDATQDLKGKKHTTFD